MHQRNLQNRAATSASSRGDSTLDSYYREVAERDLLSAEEERNLSRTIELRQIEAWVEMLSFARATSYILDRVIQSIPIDDSTATPIRRAAAAAIKTRRVAQQNRLVALARSLAQDMRELDPDRRSFDTVYAHLVELREGPSQSPRKRLPFSPRSKAYVAYLGRVGAAQRAAASARTRFVEANLRLVLTFARKHQGRGVPLSDLIQEGNMGLIKAVDRFDYRRGYRFSTFASWWIRHMLGREVANTARTVRVPVHVQDTQQRISTARRILRDKLRRVPTEEEVAGAAGVAVQKLAEVFQKVYGGVVSLDEPVGDADGRPRGEVFRDPRGGAPTPFEIVSSKRQAANVHGLLAELPPAQEDVLRKRFGLDDGKCWTLREIGEHRCLTRERIRQIQVAALAKLRGMLAADPDKP